MKCAVDDLLDVKCREMPEEREGRSVSASAVALDGKRGWGIAATGSDIRNQRGGRAMVGRDTFKVDCLHVGRDIELEKVDLPLRALVNGPRDETCNRIVL